MKQFHLLFLLSISTFGFSQYAPLSWAKALQGKSAPYNSYCDVVEMEADAAGNIYVCGNYQDTLVPDYDNQNNLVLGNDGYAFFAKYDASGNLLWTKRITRVQVRDLCLDRFGNIYLTGIYDFIGNVDFDPSANFANITISGVYAMFFARYDNNGNYIMAKAITTTGLGDTEPTVIATDSSCNIFMGGKFRSSIDMDPGTGATYINNPNTTFNCNGCPVGFYAKYDSTGAFLWAHEDLSIYQVNEIAVKPSTGDILVGGTRGASFRYVLANGTSTDSTLTGNYGHSCTSAVFDAAGNLFLGGYFSDNSGDVDWGPGSVTATSTGITDVKNFVVKYDANRVFQWMGVYDFDGSLSSHIYEFELKLSSDGNLLAAFDGVSSGITIRGFTKISTATNGPQIWTPAIFGNGQTGYTHAANIVLAGNSGSFYLHINQGYDNQSSVFDVDPNTSTYNITALGYYGLIAKYGDCTAAAATPGTISGTTALCSAGAQTYSVPVVPGVTSYTWSLPNGWSGTSNTHSIVTTPSANGGTISVAANNVCGASTASTLTVTYTAPPAVSAGTTLDTVCAGTAVTLSGGGASTYAWSNGVTNGVAFSPASTNTYTVTGTSNGCSATATVSVAVNAIPNVGANASDATLCSGEQTTLTGTNASSYVWSNGVTNGVAFSPASTTTYTVTGTASGCSATATVSVAVNAIPNVGANASASTLCSGEQTTLTGTNATSYVWSNGVTNGVAFSPASTTTYTVTGTANGCSATATVSVTVHIPSTVSIQLAQDTICAGESAILRAIGSAGYVWSTSEATDSILVTPNTTATYSITATDANNCSSTSSAELAVYQPVDVSTTVSGFTISANAANTVYQWRNCSTGINISGANSQTYTATANGEYAVIVTAPTGCADTSACVNITGVGLNDVASVPDWSLYPNPVAHTLHIELAATVDAAIIQIISMQGVIVHQTETGNKADVSVAQLASGIYLVKVSVGDVSAYRKIVKE